MNLVLLLIVMLLRCFEATWRQYYSTEVLCAVSVQDSIIGPPLSPKRNIEDFCYVPLDAATSFIFWAVPVHFWDPRKFQAATIILDYP